ncbi:2-amino-4-hydroxy-6-hydroxymethyldihydropteridine diphosphokinase [Aquibium carbonis]|uniref:2-amino-4-hydroxy-6-hydroxymethyldihydropteridine pyrophosphokinase n=1 Tax=Aquibium carbonis TaxID=2495581 RepID=A0A3R9YC79_9HYPH|nr:2-amino-4-hydroxy-6-hydroxymethyldihydropteridine diphosphokinase [Aquibium carbonis]RST87963.1 2-amino-4-hydroxy-6-hydroxymethyldihydropteridine diphosphokinase [Aquibium carbonis]
MPGRNEVTAYLGLGGNLEDPRQAMAAALRMIDSDPGCAVVAVSSIYRTPPWGDVVQPDFLNCVAQIRTSLSARALLALCLGTENALKRVRKQPGGPRVIDVDVLTYGGQTLKEPGLEIPHPRMSLRAFVMVPLREIAPDMRIGGETLDEVLQTVDRGGIAVVEPGGGWWRTD